jgi:hypothetical protein
MKRGRVDRVVFPPQEVAEVKVIACELPASHDLPLSRFSRAELHRLVIERGVTEASASTIWRWLHDDAIKPWQTRSWIFPRDPSFAEKADRALDLYARIFDSRRLRPDEYVICADEKTQLQALGRDHATVPPGPGRPGLVEFDYLRGGTLAYLAAWDVHHAKLFDLDRPAQGPDTQRPRLTPRTRPALDGLRPALPQHRPPVRMDLHPPRPRPRPSQDHPPTSAPRAGRLNTATLADTSTSETRSLTRRSRWLRFIARLRSR